MKKISKAIIGVFGWLFTIACCGVIIVSVILLMMIHHYSKDLPDYSTLAKYDPPTLTRLYANNGRLLAEFATERRVFVPLKAMPKRVINAFLSAEDKNFYTHTGIDYTSIARAVYLNAINYGQGKSLVGGSTITQQVVKNFLLSNEKSFERKVKEALLALRITGAYNKDKILELYLNEIFLGMRSYGVAAAALNYFNKSLDDLSIEEAALLAAMPKAPSSYDPRKNYSSAFDRRNWVIKRMHEDGHISSEEARTALSTPITLKNRSEDDVVDAGFFADEVRRQLTAKYGNSVVNEGGLVVRTTMEPKLQKFAEKALRDALITYDKKRGYRGAITHIRERDWKPKLAEIVKNTTQIVDLQKLAVVTAFDKQKTEIGFADGATGVIPMSALGWTRRVVGDGVLGPEVKKPADIFTVGDVIIVEPNQSKEDYYNLAQVPAVNGALVAIEPNTGRVLALAGGYSSGTTDFNRATQAMRQPGSAFKPFVYLAALENGFSPSSVVLDAPIELSQGAGLPAWRPANYKDQYLGPASLREGLAKSRNTMTVRLGQAIGIDRVIEMGQRLGVYEKLPRNMSIVLGTAETSVLNLTNAYAMIVNGGKKVIPSLIERIDDRHGKIIFRLGDDKCSNCEIDDLASVSAAKAPPELEDKRERVIDARIAYQMVTMLEGVVQRGTATKAKVLGRPLGGKTGTTNESRDTWFVGFSPELVVGLYVGYDTPRTLGKKETGGSVALPAFIEFMQAALKDIPVNKFNIPDGIENKTITVQKTMPAKTAEELELSGDLPPIDPVLETVNELVINNEEPVFKPETARELDEKLPLQKPVASAGSERVDEEVELKQMLEDSQHPLPWHQESRPSPAGPSNPFPAIPSEGVDGIY